MKSLCLNVEVLSSDGTEVELRDSDDDNYRASDEFGIDLSRRPGESLASKKSDVAGAGRTPPGAAGAGRQSRANSAN